jgi:hypothetical protein
LPLSLGQAICLFHSTTSSVALPSIAQCTSRSRLCSDDAGAFAAKVILRRFVISAQHPANNETFIAALDNALRVTLAMGALVRGLLFQAYYCVSKMIHVDSAP